MQGEIRQRLQAELDGIREAGLWKGERIVEGPQGAHVPVGRARGPQLLRQQLPRAVRRTRRVVARRAATASTAGASACRACASSAARRSSTRSSRRRSRASSAWTTRSSTRSCFDANGGALRDAPRRADDAIISDALNHASIIDGVRLCKAERQRYAHGDMAELERHLKAAAAARLRLIATDGVFSMDGDVAPLGRDLRPRRAVRRAGDGRRQPRHRLRRADRPRHAGALRRRRARRHPHLDARQGAGRRLRRLHRGPAARSSPCCASARGPTCSRTRCRPPLVAGASRAPRRCSRESTALRDRLEANTRRFRAGDDRGGLRHPPGRRIPIVPIMLGDARLAHRMAAEPARRGHLRGRLLLPGGAARQGAHPRPGERGPHGRRPRAGGGRVRQGRPRARSDLARIPRSSSGRSSSGTDRGSGCGRSGPRTRTASSPSPIG